MDKGFNLADLLKDVSNLDTNREQIEYIKRDIIDSDPNNFYSLSGVDQLADNIATCGLLQPIRVRIHPENPGRFMIVSGHRRFAAIDLLAKDEPDLWEEISCIVERDAVPASLQQLRLIYANANTRTMTSAELGEQAAQVEKLLYQLKEEGYDFPGRMRDHVAQAVNASQSKLARLKVIRSNLAACWVDHYQKGDLSESTAYALARMPEEWQTLLREELATEPKYIYANTVEYLMEYFNAISKQKCTHGPSTCKNTLPKMRHCAKSSYYGYDGCHNRCCFDCQNLRTCKYSCHLADNEKKEQRDAERKAKRDAAEQQQKREQPTIDYIKAVYERVGTARKAANVSVEKLYKAQRKMYGKSDEEKQKSMENGTAKMDVNATLPFGYGFRADDAMRLCAVADLLHCSTDFLLGREEKTQPASAWHTGEPTCNASYYVLARWCEGGSLVPDEMYWNGEQWLDHDDPVEEMGVKIVFWTELPEEDV